MAFFDKLNDLAKNIGEKTNEAIETTKLSSRVSSEKNAAGEELKKIGEFYYAQYIQTGVTAPEVLEACQAAKAHYDAADQAQAEIDRIRAESEAAKAAAAPVVVVEPVASGGGLVCSACGTSNSAGTRFCCECGNRLEVPAPPAERSCPGCGAVVGAGLKFCGSCGARVE